MDNVHEVCHLKKPSSQTFRIHLCYLLADLYVRSVYLNLFGWMGQEVHEHFKDGSRYKCLGTSDVDRSELMTLQVDTERISI
jgi:hypothetical protein